MNYTTILSKPLLTEKAIKGKELRNEYTFIVHNESTKGQVKAVVEDLYGVSVVNVNMAKRGVKTKRSISNRGIKYNRPIQKKAIVRLKDGDSLKFYEGATK